MTASYELDKCYLGGWCCYFLVGGRYNTDERGTDGTGLKIYDTFDKAMAAGERYLRKMAKNGFAVTRPY